MLKLQVHKPMFKINHRIKALNLINSIKDKFGIVIYNKIQDKLDIVKTWRIKSYGINDQS